MLVGMNDERQCVYILMYIVTPTLIYSTRLWLLQRRYDLCDLSWVTVRLDKALSSTILSFNKY